MFNVRNRIEVMTEGNIPGSFRDPNWFLFVQDGSIYRQVNALYQHHYDHLLKSGLYQDLVDAGLLIAHTEASLNLARSDDAYKIIRPEVVPFISYPYEWSFSQLKAAALASLKDSSAYNIQFVQGKPILIDTLSFEMYQEGLPWVAYRQFCQHFLAPLALMSYRDIRLNQLLRVYLDGIPLDLASSLLPFRSRFKLPLLLHIHLHARSQQHFSDKVVDRDTARGKVGRQSLLGLMDNLESAVKKLQWSPQGTDWADYYQDDSYDSVGIEHKNIQTISWDMDPGCVDINYRQVTAKGETDLLPLVLDLTNPSPAMGWENRERMSILERGPADTVLALALVHHLAISNNVPLDRIADFLAKLCRWLIIEFIPKSDPKVQRLLSMREDIFPNYTRQGFENEFGRLFEIKRSEQIRNSQRILYLMERR